MRVRLASMASSNATRRKEVMMINEPPDVKPKGRYSVKETAEKLRVSANTIYRYIKGGFLKSIVRPNGQVAIAGSEITRFWGGEYI